MAKVFVSHKSTDQMIATIVAVRMQRNGFETYLDTIDSVLQKDGPDLAGYILEKMGECQQLVAVVSSATKNSWWVPWEIGVGSEKGFLMASYSQMNVDLPSYLEKWPALHSLEDVDLYCQHSRRAEIGVKIRQTRTITESDRVQVRKSEAIDFHKKLRDALR